jgi:hypothetical protein
MASWQELVQEGWERRENVSGKKFYVTPIKNGLRKKIYQSSEIPPEYMHLQPTLYPPKVMHFYIFTFVHICIVTGEQGQEKQGGETGAGGDGGAACSPPGSRRPGRWGRC